MEQQTGSQGKNIEVLCHCLLQWTMFCHEAQVGIKIARRNINSLRYADDTTLMAESKEELQSLLMKVKERKKVKSFSHVRLFATP